MKRISKWLFIFTIMLCVSTCLPLIVQAQDGNPPSGCPDPIDGDCPIDSGLLILVSIGAAYGIKKVVDSRKEGVIDSHQL